MIVAKQATSLAPKITIGGDLHLHPTMPLAGIVVSKAIFLTTVGMANVSNATDVTGMATRRKIAGAMEAADIVIRIIAKKVGSQYRHVSRPSPLPPPT